jgi:hypothetical protein
VDIINQNTPAFKSAPYLFKDLVRDNPEHFMRKSFSPTEKKHSTSLPTEFQQRNKTTDDSTEQSFIINGDVIQFFYIP